MKTHYLQAYGRSERAKERKRKKSEVKFWVKQKIIASTQAWYQTWYPPQKRLVLYQWCTWTGDIISPCVRPLCDLFEKLCQFHWKQISACSIKKSALLPLNRELAEQRCTCLIWQLARVGLVRLRAFGSLNFKALSFSFKCQTAFRKLVPSPLGLKTETRKSPD